MARGPKIADKWYSDSKDTKSPKSGEEYAPFARVEIIFAGNVDPIGVDVADLPEDIRSQAMCHGLIQKLGDSYASVNGDVNKARDNVEAVLDELKLGNWSAEREVGPRLKDLYDAIRRVMADAGVTTVADEQLDAKYKTHADAAKNRANAKATPAVQVKLAEIEKEKADARLARLRETATTATVAADLI